MIRFASTTKSVTFAVIIGVALAGGLAPVAAVAAPSSAASASASGGFSQLVKTAGPRNACPTAITGATRTAPGRVSPLGVQGTTTADLSAFALAYNATRVANCLKPVPLANFRYDSCMEDRLFWMAESPSENPNDAWGHIGSVRIDGVPSTGCDGNLAGGYGNTGATVATKWWTSTSHRASLYRPTVTTSTANVCILFAMTHGGVPNEPYEFTRAAARWVTC